MKHCWALSSESPALRVRGSLTKEKYIKNSQIIKAPSQTFPQLFSLPPDPPHVYFFYYYYYIFIIDLYKPVILSIGKKDTDLLKDVQENLERMFLKRVFIKGPLEIPMSAYDPQRNQFNSTKILKELSNYPSNEKDKVIGITGVDLFIPIFTFVFGEAQLGGKAAIVSYARLRQEFYGLPSNPFLLKERLFKEVVHELGHTFGLVHCERKWCVMSFSVNIRNVDLKKGSFCQDCSASIKEILKR